MCVCYFLCRKCSTNVEFMLLSLGDKLHNQTYKHIHNQFHLLCILAAVLKHCKKQLTSELLPNAFPSVCVCACVCHNSGNLLVLRSKILNEV